MLDKTDANRQKSSNTLTNQLPLQCSALLDASFMLTVLKNLPDYLTLPFPRSCSRPDANVFTLPAGRGMAIKVTYRLYNRAVMYTSKSNIVTTRATTSKSNQTAN